MTTTTTVAVNRRILNETYGQAERAQYYATRAVRKAEDNLRVAQDTEREAAAVVAVLVQIMQELP